MYRRGFLDSSLYVFLAGAMPTAASASSSVYLGCATSFSLTDDTSEASASSGVSSQTKRTGRVIDGVQCGSGKHMDI